MAAEDAAAIEVERVGEMQRFVTPKAPAPAKLPATEGASKPH